MNFWKDLHNGFFALAPMEDVTDTVFREIVLSVSNPLVLPVLFTEFTSIDGLLHEKGALKVAHRIHINPSEKKLIEQNKLKLVAQIWGNDPEKFFKVAKNLSNSGDFHGIDINMGCPVKKVVKNQTCSALIKFPDLAKEIILATKEGANVPVSVKTRIGFNEIETERWINDLLSVKPAAITLHGRIQKQMSEGKANWNEIKKAVELRNQLFPECVMIGNGDVMSVTDGRKKTEQSGVDGIMVGRGIFANPWMFGNIDPDMNERLRLIKLHIELFRQTWEGEKNPAILKRFFKIYIQQFDGAANLRAALMKTRSYDEMLQTIEEFEQFLKKAA